MDWTLFLIFLVTCGVAAATGTLFRAGSWYEELDRPDWAPPDWMFPLVWALLYVVIALAATRVAGEPGGGHAMAFFALQIVLHALWAPVLFGLHNLKAGLLVIVLLWFAVLATTLAFLQIDLLAGLLIAPYLLWVGVAVALNFRLWRLNRDAPIAT